MIRTLLILLAVLGLGLAPAFSFSSEAAPPAASKAKKKKKKSGKKRRRATKARRKAKGLQQKAKSRGLRRKRLVRATPPKKGPDQVPVLSSRDVERLFKEAPRRAPRRLKVATMPSSSLTKKGRAESKVTPGAPSRWSNMGAIEPIESPVEVQAPLPQRNLPRAPGVETPGQRLQNDEDRLSARVSLSGYRLSTNGQDVVYANERDGRNLIRLNQDRDIELIRGRATLGYERIQGSEFSAYLDTEYRPRLNGDGRFDNLILNEMNVAWGLTDAFTRDGPDFGVALGRVAIREAGYAQADGAAVRWRPVESLHLGMFGGVTGNPFGYNWAQRSPELFSTDWITGGLFGRWRSRNIQVSLAGVVTIGNVPRPPPDPGSLDRIYVYADASWTPFRDVSVFATGFLDVLPSGSVVQNAEVIGAWTPGRLNLRLGLGRFSTLTYEVSTGYSFVVDPARNTFDGTGANNPPIVDQNGDAVVPFDGARLTAIYNQIRLSAGYRLLDRLELFLRANTLLRDVSLAQEQSVGGLEPSPTPAAATVNFADVRFLPAVGVKLRDPDLLDAEFQATMVVDDQSQADAILRVAVGRGFMGLYLGLDGRYLLGDIDALDGGLSITYGLPRDWFPGLLQVRGSFRYFREDVAIERPAAIDQTGQLGPNDERAVIPVQESFLGFVGVEWRL